MKPALPASILLPQCPARHWGLVKESRSYKAVGPADWILQPLYKNFIAAYAQAITSLREAHPSVQNRCLT